MGASANIEVQSQPVLPAYHSKENEVREILVGVLTLTRKEIVANFMESFKRLSLEKKETQVRRPQIKVKKARKMGISEKENNYEEQL